MRARRRDRPRSLRHRLVAAMLLAVGLSLVCSLATAVALVRRSVEQEARRSLVRQVDLVVAREQSTTNRLGDLGVFLATQEERLTILTIPQAALLLPTSGGDALRAGKSAQGHVTVNGKEYLYAARPNRDEAVILLRPARRAASDWIPFGIAFLVAGLVGAVLAAFAALLLARRLSRPIGRVAAASRQLATGRQPGPIPVEGTEEVAALAESFNHMTAELTEARESERSFLLSVSHELKTPLTAINGHAEALAEGVVPPEKVATVIMREGGRLERLVRDLLDLARLNQRAFAVKEEQVALDEIAREAVERYRSQARDFGISLKAVVAPQADARGDPDRVLQVLSNLIENALRCTPAGGTVTVTAAAGKLTVEDSGPGLDSADLEHAFERFFLYERYGRERPVGTGLGLAIVKELVDAMSGSVRVESRPGRGTSFTVTVPVAA